MSNSVNSVKLNPYDNIFLANTSFSNGEVVYDKDKACLRLMDGKTAGGNVITSLSYISSNAVNFSRTSQNLLSVSNLTSVVTLDYSVSQVWNLSQLSANFQLNFTNVPNLDGYFNRIYDLTVIINQASTAYIPNSVRVNGNTITLNWLNGLTPTGRANKLDQVDVRLINVAGVFKCAAEYKTYG